VEKTGGCYTLPKSSQKSEEEVLFPNLFPEANITLISKQRKRITRKVQIDIDKI
jgi:hypothetical protein